MSERPYVPKWVRKSAPKPEVAFERPTATSYPNWRLVSDDHYSLIPPVGCPADPVAVQTLKSFYPNAMPLYWKRYFCPPHSSTPVMIGRWVVAAHVWNPRRELALTQIERPAAVVGQDMLIPNVWEVHAEGPPGLDGAPGYYSAFDAGLVRWVRTNYRERAGRRLHDQLLEADEEAKRKRRQRLADARAYQGKHFWKWALPLIQGAAVDEYQAYAQRCREGRKAKPMVYVKGV